MTLEEIKQIAKAAYDNKVAEYLKPLNEKHPNKKPLFMPFFAVWTEIIRLPLAALYSADSTVSVVDGDFGRVAKITNKSTTVYIPLIIDSLDMNTTADNCEIVILAKYNNADDTVDFVRRVNIMLPKQVEETMSLYALGQITEEDVCYLLKRDKFYLTEEEAAYVDRLQADYEAWLIKQQIRDYDV